MALTEKQTADLETYLTTEDAAVQSMLAVPGVDVAAQRLVIRLADFVFDKLKEHTQDLGQVLVLLDLYLKVQTHTLQAMRHIDEVFGRDNLQDWAIAQKAARRSDA